jgi:metal-responsive CopG/Arc/MetJ family transcriptional regulator
METRVTETAVALPTDLFQRAEELACKWGISRSELYRRALSHLLAASHETELTRQLNEIYDQEDSSPDPVMMQLQLASLKPEEW